MTTQTQRTHAWWKEGVCYQVWPLSFKDSNGDGMGDIQGLISKLDYLKDLGVDYIWMSPMYASPRKDYGYDISDYESVDPTFGTLQDMDELIAGVNARGMRLILDLVVNHSSSEHKWFKESSRSKDNEYSDYYIWRDPKIVDGKKCPPNNWRSMFGGSAWDYVEARDQYYFHLFLDSMPDLNWEQSYVRQAIYQSAIEFWLKRGISGFRVDVVGLYCKDITFPDAPIGDPSEEFQSPTAEMVLNGPRMHEWLQEQRSQVLDKYGKDIVLIGELGHCSQDHLERYLSPVNRELDTIIDFEHYAAGGPAWDKPWTEWVDKRSLIELRKALMKMQGMLGSGLWTTSYFESHDQPRSISNFGSRSPSFYFQSGKLLALILATMSGTLFVYQGQEIGMRNLPKDWPISDLKDVFWIRFLEDVAKKYPGDQEKHEAILDVFQRCARDHARTPVQWSTEPNAGFSTAQPWMRVNDGFKEGINVKDQIDAPDSLWRFWQQLLKFRKSQPETMIYGDPIFIDTSNEHVMSVVKRPHGADNQGSSLLVVMNYSDDTRAMPSLQESELKGRIGKFLFGTAPDADKGDLQPWEGRVFELS